jgi:hypothetical protein
LLDIEFTKYRNKESPHSTSNPKSLEMHPYVTRMALNPKIEHVRRVINGHQYNFFPVSSKFIDKHYADLDVQIDNYERIIEGKSEPKEYTGDTRDQHNLPDDKQK